MQWIVIDSGVCLASENMATDDHLLGSLDGEVPILHLYDWKYPSATYGLLTDVGAYLDLEKTAGKLELAKRPTGGGIIFHLWDFAFSVLVPRGCPLFSDNTLENYALVNTAVMESISGYLGRSIGALAPVDGIVQDHYCERFCMAKATKYDVVWEGKKIAGAAQRKTKRGFLHQGSIALCMPDAAFLEGFLKKESKVMEAMLEYTYPINKGDLAEARGWFKENLQKYLKGF